MAEPSRDPSGATGASLGERSPQEQEQEQQQDARGTRAEGDVVLHVPKLSVDEVDIEVSSLVAHLSLNARLGGLLRLEAGVDVEIEDVKINIKGVESEAHLRVYLDEVARIIERTFDSIEQAPDVYREVLQQATDATTEATGGKSGGSGGILNRIKPGDNDDSESADRD